MIKLSNESIEKFLKEEGLEAQIQSDTGQVYASLKVDEREFPFFARIFEETGLLQLLAFIPSNVPANIYPDMARLLHMFNKELDVPGFGMDETIGVVFFRCMLASHKQQLQADVLKAYLTTFRTVCESFSPAIQALAAGAITLDELLRKANEAQREAEAHSKKV